MSDSGEDDSDALSDSELAQRLAMYMPGREESDLAGAGAADASGQRADEAPQSELARPSPPPDAVASPRLGDAPAADAAPAAAAEGPAVSSGAPGVRQVGGAEHAGGAPSPQGDGAGDAAAGQGAAEGRREPPVASPAGAPAATSASGSSSSEDERAPGAIEFVDTLGKCSQVCSDMRRDSMIAVDVEGIRLGRHGEICLVQIANQKGHVFLFDITVLGKSAFARGLQELLESDAIAKLFFDCRGDADALFHLYRVQPKHVLDMQVLCHKATGGDSLFLQGFAKAAGKVLPYSQRQVMKGIKEAGQALFAPERGGSLEIFKKRPMPQNLQKYCAQDVAHLFAMYKAWCDRIPQKTLRLVSEMRMLTRIRSKVVETGPQLARVDFEFPGESKKRTLASTPSASPDPPAPKAARPEAASAPRAAEARPPPGAAASAAAEAPRQAAAGAPSGGAAPGDQRRPDAAAAEPAAPRAAEEPAAKRQRTAIIQIIQPQIPA